MQETSITQPDELSPSEVSPLPESASPDYFPSNSEIEELVWRDGPMFVISPNSVLPARCLKCNAEAGRFQISRKISTVSAWYPLFSSAGWNAHHVDDRPIHIAFSLCTRHRLQSLSRIALIGLIAMGNIFSFLIYRKTKTLGPAADAMAILLPLLLAVIALSMRPLIRPRRVHHGLAWFAGAGPEFLESLPDLSTRAIPEVSS